MAILSYLQSLWPFSNVRNDDLRVSDRLVSQLDIPEETKRFVFAFREPESQAVVYVLCAQNLSERSAVDADRVVRCVKPDAVVAQFKEIEFNDDVRLVGGDEHLIPTSSLEVLKMCFLHKIGKDEYENVAGSLVLKEIFGVGFNGHFSAAKRAAEEVGSSFLLLESPFVSIGDQNQNSSTEVETGNSSHGFGLQLNSLMPQKVSSVVTSGSSRFLISDDFLYSQTLKLLTSHLIQLSLDQDTHCVNIKPQYDYEAPQYAWSVYPLLEDLHNMFIEIPSIGQALAYAQKMLHDVSKGDKIDTQMLSEVYVFRIAVEGLRIALNNAGRMALKNGSHPPNVDFSTLPDEEKSHALLANALRSQTKKFNSIVAVLDAGTLSGLRKHWNTVVPSEIMNAVEELVDESAKDGEAETNNHSGKKRKLKDKPVVAVGAGATAVIGASSLSKAVPASAFVKAVTFKVPFSLKLIMTQTQKLVTLSISKILGPTKIIAPSMVKSGLNATSSMKAAASAEKIRTVVHSVIASVEKTSLSAMRSAFYEIMRKRQVRPIGVLPWATFGCSVATCSGLLVFGDGIECVVESVPSAPSIACLGRGVESLQQASHAVEQSEISRVQKSIELLFDRFKKWKLAP
ncbi:uncharacterized protein LOC143534234 [Bidens hawaiensis]|uniref:uncharacterized protein LOC143534234 n=1 Tax=Bidens hawaiensis TaxID=980011 RepID=UPI0040495F28